VNAAGPMPVASAPASAAAEAYEFAVSSLGFALEQVGGTSALITSTSPADGKTVTALNLVLAAMKDGRKPLLVDADERARGLTRISGFGTAAGVTDLDELGHGVDTVVRPWTVGGDHDEVAFIAAGSKLNGTTAGYFRSAGFGRALRRLVKGWDVVVIDAPPVLVAAETTDLAALVDGVVLVVVPGTPLRRLAEVRERIAMTGTPILGYIYNRAKPETGRYGYGYGYYGYGYGYGQRPDDKKPGGKRRG